MSCSNKHEAKGGEFHKGPIQRWIKMAR